MHRLRRTCPATSFQLRILPTPDFADLPHLHRIQRVEGIMADPPSRLDLLHPRLLCLQISTPLRHGPSTALYRQKLDHDLRPHRRGAHHLPGNRRRSTRFAISRQTITWHHSFGPAHIVVQSCLQQELQTTYDLYCAEKYSQSGAW